MLDLIITHQRGRLTPLFPTDGGDHAQQIMEATATFLDMVWETDVYAVVDGDDNHGSIEAFVYSADHEDAGKNECSFEIRVSPYRNCLEAVLRLLKHYDWHARFKQTDKMVDWQEALSWEDG